MICIDSEHYKEKRCTRESLISDVIGEGNVIDSFFVNRGHKDGPEIHSITDTGIILIHNQKSGKMVTKLIARPQQIQRYYDNIGEEAPVWLLMIAKQHNALDYNMV